LRPPASPKLARSESRRGYPIFIETNIIFVSQTLTRQAGKFFSVTSPQAWAAGAILLVIARFYLLERWKIITSYNLFCKQELGAARSSAPRSRSPHDQVRPLWR
jgi:hypothetical protein